MNVIETEWWTMALPPEWWADSEEDSILVGDRDDVGCIEISTLHKESGDFGEQDVRAVAQSSSERPLHWKQLCLGEFTGLGTDYVEEGVAVREWYVARGPMLLFITYSCDQDNRGMDDAAVDELLDTLMAVADES